MIYDLVDTQIDVTLSQELAQIWKPFQSQHQQAQLHTELISYPEDCYGLDHLNIQGMNHCLRMGSSILVANEGWAEGRVYGSETAELAPLLEMQLYSYLLTRKTLMVHSSLVDWQGRGIMFMGPSGIGKTTQAELWAQYRNAKILNGDMVFVRENADGFYGYGSPWHGSSPYYENSRVKLDTLVILEQGSENCLTRLDGFHTLQAAMGQVFLPIWYREAMDACLETLDSLLERVPLYRLSCRPDREATELLMSQMVQNMA